MSVQPPPRPYLRTPAIRPDGDAIAFVCAGDIWLVPLGGGVAEQLTAHHAAHNNPVWSPDGNQIAYASNRTGSGDLYLMSMTGEELQRLTHHDAASIPEAWAPDGSAIYFSSMRDRQGSALYRVGVGGETPVRWLGQPYENLTSMAISPDGQHAAFVVTRDPWWRRGPNPYGGAILWIASNQADADDCQILADAPGANRWPMWAPASNGLYFVSDRDGCENIWYQALDGGSARRITSFSDGRVCWPSISANGKTIVFERDFGIWRCTTADGHCAPVTITLRHDTRVLPLRPVTISREPSEVALAPDGKKIALVVRGRVYADFADKETEKEQRQGVAFRVGRGHSRERQVAWSPDSRRLVYTSDRVGDERLFVYDFVTRTETQVTTAAGRTSAPHYSPDGTWLAYGLGVDEIRLVHLASGEDRAFIRAHFLIGASFAWSPDSAWICFSAVDEQMFSNLYVQQIDTDHAHKITFLSNIAGGGPLWLNNGRTIVFTTGQYRSETQVARVELTPATPQFRETEFEKLFDARPPAEEQRVPGEQHAPADDTAPEAGSGAGDSVEGSEAERPPEPKPAAPDRKTLPKVEIQFAGIARRLRFLTPITMNAAALCVSVDSRDLIFSATVADRVNLWMQSLDDARSEQPPRQLTSSTGYKSQAQFAPDGKSIYFLDGGQIIIRKTSGNDQQILPFSVEMTIDFAQEKRQIFGEVWRMLRDQFYDASFGGADWQALYTTYLPLVNGAQVARDMYAVLNLMIGELRSSHIGAMWLGGNGEYDGYTGIVFDTREQVAHGGLRVARVLPESPAALADGGAVQPGDVLLAVDDTPIAAGTSLDQLLQRTVGRRVRLRLAADAAGTGAREVFIRPCGGDTFDGLRYRNWVLDNEAYVRQISDGRLGYVHVRSMNYACYQRFLADLDSETHRADGVVIDVRFNGGGHTATFIIDVLMRRSTLWSAFRDRPIVSADHLSGNRVLDRPTVLVTNERCTSNTEMLSEAYQRLGLGKVVGRPTAGGVLWTYNHRLIDGGVVRLPRLRVVTSDGDNLEGRGRAVDVDVSLPIGQHAPTQDRQLDAAVRVLLDRLGPPRPPSAITARARTE